MWGTLPGMSLDWISARTTFAPYRLGAGSLMSLGHCTASCAYRRQFGFRSAYYPNILKRVRSKGFCNGICGGPFDLYFIALVDPRDHDAAKRVNGSSGTEAMDLAH